MTHREGWNSYIPLLHMNLEPPPWSLCAKSLPIRLVGAAMVVLCAVTSARLLGPLVSEDNDMLALLGAVICVSLYLGRLPAWVSCLLCLGFLSFGHGHSGFSLSENGGQVFLSLAIFLFTTHQVARLADRTRAESWRSRQRVQVMAWLKEFSQDCSRQTDKAAVHELLESFCRERLGLRLREKSSSREEDFWKEVVADLGHIAKSALDRIEQTEVKERAAVLEATQRLQATLIDSLSHDLQTPLSAVRGAFEMLRDSHGSLEEISRRQLLDLGFAQTNRLLSLVRNLLSLAKLQGGGLRFSAKPIEVSGLLELVLQQFDSRMTERIQVEIPPGSHRAALWGDRTLLSQAMFNLIDNGLKFSSEGEPIFVGVDLTETEVVLEVSDRGYGIESHESQLIFERFFRGTTLKRIPGSGLGLHLCREIVSLHHGHIDVESDVGRGSRFQVFLPRAREGLVAI